MSKQDSQTKSAISLTLSFTPTMPELLLQQDNDDSGMVGLNNGMRGISLVGPFA